MNQRETLFVTLALLLSNAIAGLDGTIINTALPAIVRDLHAIQYMGWIVATFLLGMAVSTPLWSKLGERIGNRKAYQISALLFIIGAIFQAISGNIIVFLLARGLMGVGAGGMNALPFIIYADIYKNLQSRGRIIGYAAASFSAASIIGPLLGGWIIDELSWHWVFYINIPIALISIFCLQVFFKEQAKKESNKKPIDYRGATLLVFSLVALLIGIESINAGNILLTGTLIIGSLILLVLLIKVEEGAADPIIPNRLFKNKQLMVDFFLFSLLWGAFIAFNIYVPLWVQSLLGMSAVLGGITQMPGAVTNFVGSMFGPVIQPLAGKFRVIALGTLSFMVAFAILLWSQIETPLWVLLVAGAFQGFGLGLSFNILQISVQTDAEQQDIPIATSFAFLLRVLSQTFMAAIYGMVLTQALMEGIEKAQGKISLAMLNQLSDAQSLVELPAESVLLMRQIMYTGLHNIMLLVLVILLAALLFNVIMQFSEKKSKDT